MNATELNSFTFAMIDCDIITIKNYLEKQDYKYKIIYENIDVESFYFRNMYLQPIKGIAKGLFYNSEVNKRITIGLGNGRGCWGSLINNISVNLSVRNIQIELNSEHSDIFRNQFIVSNGRVIREVQRLLGDKNKKEFTQNGNPLWFENVECYKKRRIKDRINKNILIEYASKIGIDLTSSDFLKTSQKSLYVELGNNKEL